MLQNFTFTVTIPKFKNIWWEHEDGFQRKRQFGKLSFKTQEAYFEDLVNVATTIIGVQQFALPPVWVVEKFPTDPTRYHMHGTFYEITCETMKTIQTKWAEKIGFRFKKQQDDCIHITSHHCNWDEYIMKDQEIDREEIANQDWDKIFDNIYKFKGKNNLNIE